MTTEPATQGRSEAPLPDTTPSHAEAFILPEVQLREEQERLAKEIAASYDSVGIGTFFDQLRPGKRRPVKLADGTVITGG